MGSWCILRTSARHTVRLAETIAKEGVEAWTPTVVSRPNLPKRRARVTLREPILPRFVFASADSLPQLLALSHAPLAGFTILRHGERIAIVAEASLGPLRKHEDALERARLLSLRKAEKRDPLPIGAEVLVPGDAWRGLKGTVVRSDSNKTVIALGKWSVEVETWQVPDDSVAEAAESDMDMAA